jgi:cell wall assembly regulator SMI1
MKAIWSHIESWLEANAPTIRKDLLKGATLKEIRTAEQAMGITFPENVKDSYRIHNGQRGRSASLIAEWQLYSLKDMVNRWKMLKKLFDDGTFASTSVTSSKAVRAEWWNPKWIPVAYNGDGDLRCLDLAPTPQGEVGQIISFWHMENKRERLASSFRVWLTEFADDLHAGKYEVEDAALVPAKS